MFEVDEEFLQRERLKAKVVKKSRWWQNLIQNCHCYYCEIKLSKDQVTMDHVVPMSRGGKSVTGNLVPACKTCNMEKRSLTPVEWEFFLARQKPQRG